MTRFLLVFKLLALFAVLPIAQISGQNNLRAEYKNAASAPNFLNVCGDADHVVVTVRTEGLSGTARTGISAALQLFKGVEIVALDPLTTSPGVVLSGTANRNRPVFTLPDLAPNGTASVQVGFTIAADCAYVDSIAANNDAEVYDTWNFTYNLGGSSGLTETDRTDDYRTAFKVPTFTLSFDQNDPPPSKVGDCYSRTLTAANSALEGFVDTLIYTDRLGAGVSLKQLYINNVAIPFTKTLVGGDTLIRAYIWGAWLQTALLGGGPGDGDVFLDPDERLVITEDICYVSCSKSNLSTHSTAWGCKGKVCTSALVNGFVRKGDGAPNALIVNNVALAENVKVGYCKAGKYVIHYSNNGSEIDPGFALMKDLEVQIGMGIQVLTQNTFFKITGISLAGRSIAPIAATTVLNGNALFNTDPDGPGGLADADGDGFFDDLPTGRNFDLVVDFTFNCDSANLAGADSLCLNEFNVAWNAYLKYTDPCLTRITKSLPNFGGIQNTNEEFLNCIDPDAYPGQPFTVQHIETRGVRTFEKDCGGQERLVVWVVPPPGVLINVAGCQLFKNNSTTPTPLLSNSVSNDTTYLFFDATGPFINGKYDFRVSMTPDCSIAAGRIEIPFGIFHACPPCGCRHSWYCSVLDGPQYHPTVPPCAAGVLCPRGLQTTDFDVERTTFGFSSAAYTTPMNPANANKDVAIFCDTVKATVSNVVGQTPVVDSFGVVISYDNVDYLKDTNEIFLYRRGFVRIKKAVGGQVFNCAIDSTHLTVVRDDTTKTLTFRFDHCLQNLGITLAPGDSVKFFGWFLVNPKGPLVENFRKVPNFRAYGFAIFDGTEYACDNFGENFSVAKIPTVFATPGGSEFPKGCSTTPFQYRLVTKNVGFSQYYTGGEYYAAVKVDSLVLDYDTLIVNAFQNLKVEVSIPGHPKFGNNFYVIPTLNPGADRGHYVARFDTLARVPSYNAVTSYSFNLRISVTPGCESLTGSALGNANFRMNPTMYYTDRYFAKNFGDGSCADKRKDARVQNLTYSDPPTVGFEPVTNPNLLLTNDTAVWVVKQCNTTTKADASLTWLAAQYDTAQLQVIGFDVIDNPLLPQILPLATYGGGKVFATTPGVLRQAANNTATQICNTVRVRAVLKQCGTFPLRLSMGWNCAPYADPFWNPDAYAPCAFDTLGLTVTALDPAIDATIVNQPVEFPSLCDTLSLDMLVRNTGQGSAFDVKTRFSVPLLGATLVPGSVEIAHPSDGAFVPALFDPAFLGTTLRGQFYQYANFDSLHAGLAVNGLPGFDPLLPGGTNEFKVRYKFTTGCAFLGGVQTFYAFSGKKVCGLPTNSESGESLPIQVAGISAGASARFSVSFDPGSLLAASGTSELIVSAENVTDTLSDSQDKIQVKLPPGILYVQNSSEALAPGTWVPGNPQIEVVGGIQILSWTLPVGLGLGDVARLRFGVSAPALDCNGQLEASVLTVREINYTCPGGALTCPVDVLTAADGEKFFDLNVGQTEDYAGPDATVCPGAAVQLDAAHSPPYTDYSWSPADGLSDPTIANPLASPSVTTVYTITSLDSSGCAKVDQLTVNVQNPLTASATADDATCGQNNGIVTVSASGGSGNYDFNWQPNVSTSFFATDLAPGDYMVTVTDAANGCTAAAFAALVAAGGGAVSFNVSAFAATTLAPAGGSVSLQFAGGTSPYEVAWAGPVSGSQSGVNQPVFTISSLSTGNYSITVTDDFGCTQLAFAFVPMDVVDNLFLNLTTAPDTSCCYSLGIINISASGGTGNYAVSWVPSFGQLTDLGGGFFRIDSVPAGQYFVRVDDASGLSRTQSATVADGCVCGEIFDEEVILVPEGVEKLCIPIPYIFFPDVPIKVNGAVYTGPYTPCDFDSVVYYAFSFLPDNGFAGPFRLDFWQCNQMNFHNVVFQDLYDLVDSMRLWDPAGDWLLDDNTSLIFGGDPFDQNFYGHMRITHLPTFTPFTVRTNYTQFAYGTEIFVSPFDGKAVVTAYDSATCCTDTLCIQFVNPCEDLLPSEPFAVFEDDPAFCIPIAYAELDKFYVFMDRLSVYGLAASCNGGLKTSIPVPGMLGPHELIVIDTARWCADTAIVLMIERLSVDTILLTINQGGPPPDVCVPVTDLPGDSITVTVCGLPQHGVFAPGLSDTCFVYVPDSAFVGTDNGCVVACDELGVCDTTIFEFYVIPSSPPIPTLRDTFYLTTEVNTPIYDICLPVNELQGPVTGIGFCNGPNHGVFINIGVPCFNYVPDSNFVGLDQVCALVCDATGTCDTAIFIIMVETADTSGAMPNADTIFISTPVNTPYTNLCLSTAELTGAPVAIPGVCGDPNFGDFLPYGSTCVHFQPAQDFVGLDFGCLYVCDNQGVCDTTFVVIMVTPNDSTPDNHNVRRDTIELVTVENTPIAETCADASQLPAFPVSMDFCQPLNGFVSSSPTGIPCFRYDPAPGFSGTDEACVIICDLLGVCDTTVILLTVLPDNQVPVTDTLRLTLPENSILGGICLSEAELNGPAENFDFCKTPGFGVMQNVLLPCFSYDPDPDFVGNDTVCMFICDAGGLCDTTILLITVTDTSTMVNPPLLEKDTLRLTTLVNDSLPNICLDLTELPGQPGAVQFCQQPQNGTLTAGANSCLTYTPDADFVGQDSACVFICSGSGATLVCDTTLIFISVENPPPPPAPTPDTLRLTTFVNDSIPNICLDLTELPGLPGAIEFCQQPQNGTLTAGANSCLTYTPDADFVGQDSACVFICSGSGATLVCDTTIIFITVENPPPPPAPTPDTLRLTTFVNDSIPNICLDLTELPGLPGAIEFCAQPQNGTLTAGANSCLTYTPDADFVGQDSACVFICSGSGATLVCDTTIIFITVENPPPPPAPTPDTLRLTTFVNDSIPNICLDLTELPGQPGAVQFCQQPQNGTLTAGANSCLTYTPDVDFVGQDSACVFVCSGSGATLVCDTTIIFISVENPPPPPAPTPDTLRLTTFVNDSIPNICLDLTELPGQPGAIEFCEQPQNGTLTAGANSCLTYTPDADFVGQDSACVFICSGSGATLVCDTTIIFISVENPPPPPPAPTPDTLRLTTFVNDSIPNICLDLTELPGQPGAVQFCQQPQNGTLTAGANSCLTYTPDADFVGQDSACVFICSGSGATLVCDTTIIFISVENPPAPNLTTDTLYLATDVNVSITGICLDLTELPGQPGAIQFCEAPSHGALGPAPGSCLIYVPDLDFVGLDTACVFVCSGSGAGLVCDTTILFILVETPTDPNGVFPNRDTIYLTTPENTPLAGICLSQSELSGTSDTLIFCGQPANGIFTSNSDSCLTYTPAPGFVGTDFGCVTMCDDSGTCDTFTLVILVTPDTVPPPPTNPEPDTLRYMTDYQTATPVFCIPTGDLAPGASDTLIFCGLPAHGVLTTQNDSCLVFTPDNLFSGNDTACVILCTPAGGDCDTTILIFTVLPPSNSDCGIFSEDSITLEIGPTEPFGLVCIEGFMLTQLLDFAFFDNGQAYANGFFGCDYDSCFAYTYFTVPDLGANGPYQLDYWAFNGDTLRIPNFQNLQVLLDSMNVWDPLGGWTDDPATLTFRTCTAPSAAYGDMKITQLQTAAFAEIEVNKNLQPQGTQIRLTPGQHLVTVLGSDCVDSLWVNVLLTNEIEIDTFIYLDAGPDTICLADLGVNLLGVTNIEFLCPDASGTNVGFALQSLTGCLVYEGIAVGVDTFCMKLTIGTDSCLYITVRVSVLEALPCLDFIAESTLDVPLVDCEDAEICLSLPFIAASGYDIQVDGTPAGVFPCAPNGQGLAGTGMVFFGPAAVRRIVFAKIGAAVCRDTVLVNLTCDSVPPGPDDEIVRDTVFVGQTDGLCFDTTGQGILLFIGNDCAGSSGQFIDFQVDISTGCMEYTGLSATGTDTACVVACFGSGVCDTVLLLVTVVPRAETLPPVAVTDYDTVRGNDLTLLIPMLYNDTLHGALTETRILVQPAHGIAALFQNNGILYEPDASYCDSNDPDSLLYLICNMHGCDSAWVFVWRPCSDIVVFNGVSANGDGMNDEFFIEGIQFFPDNQLKIFNRWGALVFDKKGYENTWKGDWNESPLPDGVYFYLLDDGKGRVFKGYLMLLR